MFLKAIGDSFIIKVHQAKEKEGKIFLLKDAQEPKMIGTVLSVGPEVKEKRIKIGSVILFKQWEPQEMIDGDTLYGVLRDHQVLGIWDEEEV